MDKMMRTYDEKTYAVFGDVHAHIQQLTVSLEELGWDKNTFALPKNLTIIQAGDLIHKGPSTNDTVALVDAIIKRNNHDPDCGGWVQLMGNHESQYFENTVTFWPMECDFQSVQSLWSWFEDGSMRFAYLIPQENGRPYVVTHGGVNPFWYFRAETRFNDVFRGVKTTEAIIQKARTERTPENFVEWINSLTEAPFYPAKPGAMLHRNVSSKAGPVWAESAREVYSMWREGDAPFHQIHGHATPYIWQQEKFYPTTPMIVQHEIEVFRDERRTLWRNTDGAEFHCIDNGFEHEADSEYIHPLLVTAKGITSFRI